MYTYIYISRCRYTYICTYTYTYIRTYVYTYVYMYKLICFYVCIHGYLYTYAYTKDHQGRHNPPEKTTIQRPNICICIYLYIYMYTHTKDHQGWPSPLWTTTMQRPKSRSLVPFCFRDPRIAVILQNMKRKVRVSCRFWSSGPRTSATLKGTESCVCVWVHAREELARMRTHMIWIQDYVDGLILCICNLCARWITYIT